MTPSEVLERIEAILYAFLDGVPDGVNALTHDGVAAGKLYEAYVLALVIEHLAVDEQLTLVLSAGTKLALKSSPGPINRSYPHIEVSRNGVHVADVWTDIEFTAYSCARSGQPPSAPGHFHELDIVVADRICDARPKPEQLWLGVECKHRVYSKALLRELLGVRRELGLLSKPQQTRFAVWPRDTVPADPPVCLVAYSSYDAILNYTDPGATFGIEFVHAPLT